MPRTRSFPKSKKADSNITGTNLEYSTVSIIEALEQTGGLVSLAAKKLGCSTQTIVSRAKKEPEIQEAINTSREAIVDHAELALKAAVLDREPWAVQFVLRTLGRTRGYVEKSEVEENSNVTIRVEYGDSQQTLQLTAGEVESEEYDDNTPTLPSGTV